MSSIFSNVFSSEEIAYLTQLPAVVEAKAKLNASSAAGGREYFTIPLTDSIRNTLLLRLGLDLYGTTSIPMRWIKGDTPSHKDAGQSNFENTYLVYLNDSVGEFILDTTTYSITANTGFAFNEGLLHKTQNTGTLPRLLLGPMNEFAEPVGGGATIAYYDNYADAFAQNGNAIAYQGTVFVLGDLASIYYGSILSYTSWRVAYIYGSPPPTGVYSNGFDLFTLGLGSYTYYVYPATPCFLEGTQILCQIAGVDKYVPIETLQKGDLVKTSRDGYKKVEILGKGEIVNPGHDERIEDRLYKCSVSKYPELNANLYLTGCHSILVDTLSAVQREKTIKQLGQIFVTDKKYRLMACVDELAEPWTEEGRYNIWHIALEHADVKMNYGIYVNGGLLVETCSLNFLKNKTNMHIV